MAENSGTLQYLTTEQDAVSLYTFISSNENLFVSSGIYDKKTRSVNFELFLKTKGKSNKSNYNQIYDSLFGKEKQDFQSNYIGRNYSNLKLKAGVTLSILIGDLEKVALLGKNITSKLEQSLSSTIITTLGIISAQGDNYVPLNQITLKSNGDSGVKIINENFQVWVYSKSLDKIIDISPFIDNLTTSKSTVGSFTFSLSPIKNEDDLMLTGGNVLSSFQLDKNKLIDYFNKNIQMNDVVFIRFERFKVEEKYEKTRELYTLEVPFTELNDDRVFDMIGLVDTVDSSVDFNNTNYGVHVSGRDLMKVLIEDGSYFLERTMQSNGGTDYIYGDTSGEDFFSRLEIGGGYNQYFFSQLNKKIEDIVGFVFNHLSNLGIVDSNVFNYIKREKSEKYNIVGSELSTEKVKGIWQIMDVIIDDKTLDRSVDDASLSYPDAPMMTFLSKVCHEPFVEWWGDTFYNEFKFIFRRPPFSKKDILSVINKGGYHTIENIDLLNYNLGWETEFYSWYRFDVPDSLLGRAETFAAMSPIIYFNEFMYYFGNHSKISINPYLPDSAYQTEGENDKYFDTLLEDMLWVIETHIYLPFTRKGTITINGDRRIKKGSFIKLNKTNELFYVDSVQNSVTSSSSIDRTTTITVKRGMEFDHIKGGGVNVNNSINRIKDFSTPTLNKKVDLFKQTSGNTQINRNFKLGNTQENKFLGVNESQLKPSYFEVVDLQLIKNNVLTQQNIGLGVTRTPKSNTTLKSILNNAVFNYFIKRRQWKE